MKPSYPAASALMSLLLLCLTSAHAADDYEPGPDSQPLPDGPKGEILNFSFERSKIFPGTFRDYWVYVPAQYQPDLPACLYVNQDGIQWRATTVLDNLIHKKEMPVTIGVFVMHGRLRAGKGVRIALDGKVTEFIADTKRANGQAFGPDGRLYAVAGSTAQILAYNDAGAATEIASGIAGNDIVVAQNGNIYVTDPSASRSNAPSKIWLIKPGGEKRIADTDLRFANGITLSPDQTQLYVTDHRSHWIHVYQIQPDGSLAARQRYGWLHVPDDSDDAGADGIRTDREGRLYIATRMGIQVCDQAGRVQSILPAPNRSQVANLCFGGESFDTLFAACGDKVYRRKLRVAGANAWAPPHRPERPRL